MNRCDAIVFCTPITNDHIIRIYFRILHFHTVVILFENYCVKPELIRIKRAATLVAMTTNLVDGYGGQMCARAALNAGSLALQ